MKDLFFLRNNIITVNPEVFNFNTPGLTALDKRGAAFETILRARYSTSVKMLKYTASPAEPTEVQLKSLLDKLAENKALIASAALTSKSAWETWIEELSKKRNYKFDDVIWDKSTLNLNTEDKAIILCCLHRFMFMSKQAVNDPVVSTLNAKFIDPSCYKCPDNITGDNIPEFQSLKVYPKVDGVQILAYLILYHLLMNDIEEFVTRNWDPFWKLAPLLLTLSEPPLTLIGGDYLFTRAAFCVLECYMKGNTPGAVASLQPFEQILTPTGVLKTGSDGKYIRSSEANYSVTYDADIQLKSKGIGAIKVGKYKQRKGMAIFFKRESADAGALADMYAFVNIQGTLLANGYDWKNSNQPAAAWSLAPCLLACLVDCVSSLIEEEWKAFAMLGNTMLALQA